VENEKSRIQLGSATAGVLTAELHFQIEFADAK
jgi:hypothetical protein